MTDRSPRRFAVACAVMTALLLSACDRSGSAEQLLTSAKGYKQRQDHAAAVVQLKSALQKDPNLAEARLLLGLVLLETGDPAGAVIELDKALESGASPDDVEPARARALLLQGNLKAVIDQFAGTRLTVPAASAELHTIVASAHAASGDRERARGAVLLALQEAPEYLPAALVHARLLAGDGDLAGAMSIADEALQREPTHLTALLLKAELQRFGMQDRALAMQTYAQAIEAHPRAVSAHAALVAMLFELNELAAARERFEPMRASHPQHPETLLFQAQFALLDGDHRQARDIAEQLLRALPDDPRVLRVAGGAQMRLGALSQAETHLSRAVARRPNEVLQRQLLAQVYVRTGQPSRALEVLGPILNASNPDSSSMTLAGEALLQAGDPARAERLFARAARDNPQATTARTALALGQVARGETAAGFAALEAVAADDPGTLSSLALVAARMRTNDLPGALRAIDDLARKQPDQPNAHVLRAQVLLQQRDLDGARDSFEKGLTLDPLYYPAVAGLASMDLAAGRPEGAQRRLDDLLKLDRRNHHALLGLAELKARSGASRHEVTAALNRAVQAAPEEIAPRAALVSHHLSHREFTAALAAAQAAHAALPGAIETLDLLGTAQLAAGENRQAVATFARVTSQRPDRPESEFKLGQAHLAAGDLPLAKRSFRRTLELRPGLVEAQRGLAQIALREGQPQEALNIARAMQRADPRQAAGYVLEADIEAGRQRPDASLGALRKGLEAAPSIELVVRLHRGLVATQRSAEAERLAANWIRERPRDVEFLSYLGDSAMGAKDWSQAEQHYRKILEINPDRALVMNNVAWLMLQRGASGALPVAERANQLLPGHPALMNTLAMALAADGQVARALEVQQRSLEVVPGDPKLKLTLAKLHLQAGDRSRARQVLRELQRLGEQFDGQQEVAELLGRS
jgi:cellulose synthase operon protein C